MNKYDFGYELQHDSTIEWAYDKVEEQSIVLELGPSNGNLAKHLLNEKRCIIDIIEIDEEAGGQAKIFSRNSCIGGEEGDLEKSIWEKKLEDQRYDYIIILDVLEHLKNPLEVLRRLRHFLKEEGRILVSIPNLAHNSVIIGLLNNHFRYTDVGLLDCTHLKFFTYESVIEMVYSSGYYVDSEEIKQIKVGNNEISSVYEDVPRQVQSYLKTRHMGEAYQFLMVLKKGDQDKRYRLNDDLYEQKQYEFNVFNESCELFYSTSINPLKNIDVTIPVDSQDVIGKLRIDPLDKNCILNRVAITVDYGEESKECQISQNTGIDFDSKIIFFDDDPQIYIDINSRCQSIRFCCEVVDFDSANLLQIEGIRDYIRKLIKNDSEVYGIISSDKRMIESLHLQNKDFACWLENSRQEVKLLEEEKQKLQNMLDANEKSLADLKGDLEKKDSQIINLKREIEEGDKSITKLEMDLKENNDQLINLTEIITDGENKITSLSRTLEERERELALIKQHFLYRFWRKIRRAKHDL